VDEGNRRKVYIETLAAVVLVWLTLNVRYAERKVFRCGTRLLLMRGTRNT